MEEVRVIWIDSLSFSYHWYTLDEVKEFKVKSNITKGLLVHEDDLTISVAQTWGDSSYFNIFMIPKGSILWMAKEGK